jgi:hypothetical protein
MMNTQATTIRNPWLTIARILWVALLTLKAILVVVGFPELSRQFQLLSRSGLSDTGVSRFWTPAGLSLALSALGLTPIFLLIFFLILSILQLSVYWTVGLLIFWRKSNTWLGLFTSYVLVGIGLTNFGSDMISIAMVPMPWRFFVDLATFVIWPALFIFLILFPDGRFVPRWTRFLPLAWIIVYVVTETSSIFNSNPSSSDVLILLLASPLVLITIACVIYRYARVFGPMERQQSKWFLYSIVLFFGGSLTIQYLIFKPLLQSLGYGPQAMLLYLAYQIVSMLLSITLPISIGIAIFQYRLWDIDIIIRKTLVYSVVTILLALVYIGGVLLLQGLFAGLGVGKSPVAIVLSTLAIAALFNPVRRWVQNGVDRRFFRKKYDSEQALTAFAAQARDEVDMERLWVALVSTLEKTVQPAQVSLWLEASGLQVANSLAPPSGEHQSASQAGMMEMDIVPGDPLRARLLNEIGVVEIDALELDSAALRRLKEAGVKISAPLISQGELIGVLNLGPRRSEQGYSSDDGRLISNLAIRAAPALRVA